MILTNCQTIQKLLPEYQVGALGGYRLRLVEKHLAQCPGCQRELDALVATAKLLDGTKPLRPSRDLWPEVSRQLRPRNAAATWWKLLAPTRPRVAVATAGLLVVVAAVIILLPMYSNEVPAGSLPHATDEEAPMFAQWHAQATLTSALADPYPAVLVVQNASGLGAEPR